MKMRIWIKAVLVLYSYFEIIPTKAQQTGVYLRLKNKVIFADDIVPINVIGITTNDISHPVSETNDHTNGGLQCVTDKPNCCRVGFRIRVGEWYFPDQTKVPILGGGNSRATTFFRNRGENDGTVNLNRIDRSVTSPTGQFCCEIPDSMNTHQNICVTITAVTIRIIPLATSVIDESFTLQCSAHGAGDFLTWIDWLNIEHTSGITINNDSYRSSVQLQFVPLQASHAGVYTCQAKVGNETFNKTFVIRPVDSTVVPSRPQNFTSVSYTTSALLSWTTPLHPRRVVNYTLTCLPLVDGVDPVVMTYSEAGSYSLNGFRPATVYNCHIYATNSIGSSPLSKINMTTVDESSQIHLWIVNVDNCSEWTVTSVDNKMNSISSAIINSVEVLCQCAFVRDRITSETFRCGSYAPMVSNIVVYGASIHGTGTTNSSELLSYIQQWLTDNATLSILGEVLIIKPSKEECCTEMTVTTKLGTTSSLNITSDSDYTLLIVIGGSSSAGVVVIAIVVVMTIAVSVICKHQKQGQIRMHKKERVQEQEEENKYKNLCTSRLQTGVYVEECDYGEIKVHSESSRNDETQVSHTNERECVDIIGKPYKNQSQTISYQHPLSPESKLSVKAKNSHSKCAKQENAATKRARNRDYTIDEKDEEEYDDKSPHNKTKSKHLPYNPHCAEAKGDYVMNRNGDQKAYRCTALPHSSTATTSVTGYQPLLRRECDYENSHLQGYDSMINTSKSRNANGSDDDYDYVPTNPKYYYRPSVK